MFEWRQSHDSRLVKRSMSKTLSVVVVMVLAGAAFAQQSAQPASRDLNDQEIKALRSDMRSDKKQIIAANMPLSEAQAEKFWPIYEAYRQELAKVGDERQAIVQDYAKNFNSLSDAQADELANRMLAVDASAASLRKEWTPKFRKVLTAKQT